MSDGPRSAAREGSRPAPEAFRNYRDLILRLGVLAVALVTARSFCEGAPGLPLDDAYIHLTFARNLAHGHGFCFNPGEFSLGFSSPLWVLLMAALAAMGADEVMAARTMSIIAFAGSAVLIFDLVRISAAAALEKTGRPTGSRWPSAFGVVAGLFMSASGNLLWLAGSGMEAMVFLFLGLAGILLLGGEKPRPLAGGAVLGLLILTRPTGLVLWALLAAVGAAVPERRKKTAAALGLALLIAGPWFIYSLVTTGFIMPPTRAGKLASDLFNSGFAIKGIKTYVVNHLIFLGKADRGMFYFAVFALAAALTRLVAARAENDGDRPDKAPPAPTATGLSPAGLLFLWALFHFGAHALFFRSASFVTPYHHLRYQVMLIPAVIGAGSYSFFTAALYIVLARREKGGGEGKHDSAPGGASLHLALGAALVLVFIPFIAELGDAGLWRSLYRSNVSQLQGQHRAAADWVSTELPPDARIACLDIGILGFYSGRHIIDLGGLTDPEILPYLDEHRLGPFLVKKGATHYFEMVRPDSDRITGVMLDRGRLYQLSLLRSFQYPAYSAPSFLHSLGIEAYELTEQPG